MKRFVAAIITTFLLFPSVLFADGHEATDEHQFHLECTVVIETNMTTCEEFNYIERLQQAQGIGPLGDGDVGDSCKKDSDCKAGLICATGSGCGSTPGAKCCRF